jgi:hypothetical protein
VRYGQDAHLIFPDEKDERVREAGEQGPPDLKARVHVLKPRKVARAPSDERESGLHLIQELAPQSRPSGFISDDRFGQLVRDFRCEPDTGYSRLWENFDVAPDGQSFVMIRGERRRPWMRIHVVLNWLEEFERRAPKRP